MRGSCDFDPADEVPRLGATAGPAVDTHDDDGGKVGHGLDVRHRLQTCRPDPDMVVFSRGRRAGIRVQGPQRRGRTLSFRVYGDPANVDYPLFVEHLTDQAACDAHAGSAAYRELIASLADLIAEVVEIDHELLIVL